MARKTLNQQLAAVPYREPKNPAEKKANKDHVNAVVGSPQSKSEGALLARNRRLYRGQWDLALNDDNLMGRLYDMLRTGNYVETAVLAAGIPKSVYTRWRTQGEKDLAAGVESECAMFVDGLDSLHAMSEVELTKLIYDSAVEGTKLPVGACWLLERVRGSRFKQNVPAGATTQAIQVNINGVAAPAAGENYKAWLENKKATDEALAERPRLEAPEAVEVPVGIETLSVGGKKSQLDSDDIGGDGEQVEVREAVDPEGS